MQNEQRLDCNVLFHLHLTINYGGPVSEMLSSWYPDDQRPESMGL